MTCSNYSYYQNKFILGDNIWLLLGDGNLPVRSQEPQTKMPFPKINLTLFSIVPLGMESYSESKNNLQSTNLQL